METEWPSVGPDFNNWQMDLKGFIALLLQAENIPFWTSDFDLKYLTIRIDTRDNNFLVYVDGRGENPQKVRIDPKRVQAAIERYTARRDGQLLQQSN